MRLIHYLCSLTLLALTACAQYEDLPSHERYPSERIQSGLNELAETLQSSRYGWDLVLLPGGGRYGGINLSMSFQPSGEVLMSSEEYQEGAYIPSVSTNPGSELVAVTDKTFLSSYHVSNNGGLQLTFDSYNVALHSWANPVWGLPDSYDGDLAFRVDSISRDRSIIYLRGLRTKAAMRLVQRSAQDGDKLAACYAMKQQLQGKALAPLTLGGETYSVSIFGFARQLSLRHAGKQELLPFYYTPEGIRLLQPFVVGTDSLISLRLSADALSMATNGGEQLALFMGNIDLTRSYIDLYATSGNASDAVLAEAAQAQETQNYDAYPGTIYFTTRLGRIDQTKPVMASYIDAGSWYEGYVDYYTDYSSVYGEPTQVDMVRILQRGISWLYAGRALDRFYSYLVSHAPYTIYLNEQDNYYNWVVSVADGASVWMQSNQATQP